MNLLLRRIVAPAMRLVSPGCTACHHCGRPWTFAESHSVRYYESESRSGGYPGFSKSIFFACTDCWPDLSPEEKVRYCAEVVEGSGSGWRWNEAWDPNSALRALRAVARDSGASTDAEVNQLILRAVVGLAS